jgi:6-phosphogluconolactonase
VEGLIMSQPQVEAFASREDLYDAAASVLVAALTTAVATYGEAGFAATGGTTPAPVYDRLAQMTAPWDKVTVTLTDERWVPPSHAGSNEGLVRRHLLVGEAAKAGFAPLYVEGVSQEEVCAAGRGGVATATPFGAVLLGVGADGHFASLFPGSPCWRGASTRRPTVWCWPRRRFARAGHSASQPDLQRPDQRRPDRAADHRRRQEGVAGRAGRSDLADRAILKQDRAKVRILWAE